MQNSLKRNDCRNIQNLACCVIVSAFGGIDPGMGLMGFRSMRSGFWGLFGRRLLMRVRGVLNGGFIVRGVRIIMIINRCIGDGCIRGRGFRDILRNMGI